MPACYDQAGRYLADLLEDEHAGIAAAAESALDAAAAAGEPWLSQVRGVLSRGEHPMRARR